MAFPSKTKIFFPSEIKPSTCLLDRALSASRPIGEMDGIGKARGGIVPGSYQDGRENARTDLNAPRIKTTDVGQLNTAAMYVDFLYSVYVSREE